LQRDLFLRRCRKRGGQGQRRPHQNRFDVHCSLLCFAAPAAILKKLSVYR
jgi:hypothetical protein